MITKAELAEKLKAANVEELARLSGVSIKTIYRLRHMKHAPTLDTVEALVVAMDRMGVNAHADTAKAA
jgi:transcriptional regulator with XRE-family HTH domain